MLAVLAACGLSALYQPHEEKTFLSWMRNTNQIFSGEEYHFRMAVFMSNHRSIQEHNKAESTFKLGHNQFSAMTPAEYKALLGHRTTSNVVATETRPSITKPLNVDSYDWREHGIVNPVKDQGQCGSCWAFSVIQAQESQWALKKSQLLSLAEQNLVDCASCCYGCNGGDESITYDYVIKHQNGLWMLEEDYPYTARDGSCKFQKAKGVSKVVSWYRPAQSDEEKLAAGLVEGGVVSIAIDASHYSFQLYSSGVYDEPKCSPQALDHAVGLVGFGVDNGVKYWIVRNSWGASWGENGYIRMVRGKKNQCGVATDCVIPRVE